MASLSDDARVIELEDALRRAQRKLAKREDDREAVLHAIHQGAKDALLLVGQASPVPRGERDRRKGPEVALVHATDWQVGKETPGFDSDVAEERVRKMAAKVNHIAEIQRTDHPVRECHVLLGGDMVEGVSIFPGQPFEIDSSTFEQAARAKHLIETLVLTLLEGFEIGVHVYQVSGNHGRIGRKGDSPREDNWDSITYAMAREALSNQERLTWHVPAPRAWYSIVEIGNYRAMLVHGDQIKSWGGNFPGHGILKKANAWAAGAIPDRFRDIYIGHMHQPMELQMAHGGMVYMTPSLESNSPYAQEFVGAHGLPGQRLHFIDPKRGRVTPRYSLDFDE